MAIWKIAAVGLQSRDQALLETTIDLAAGIETGRWQLVSQQASAQVILANIDSAEGQTVLQSSFDETSALVVPYASAEAQGLSGLYLTAPASYRSITKLLKKLESQLLSRRQKQPTPVTSAPISTEKKQEKVEAVEPESTELESTELNTDEAVLLEEVSDQSEPLELATEESLSFELTSTKPESLEESATVKSLDWAPVDLEPIKFEFTELNPASEVHHPHEDTPLAEKAANLMQDIASPDKVETLDEDVIDQHKIDWLCDEGTEELEDKPLIAKIVSSNDAEFERHEAKTQTFVANTRLLGLIMSSIESGNTTQISHKNYPELRIFPDNGWFIFSKELDGYPEMFREPAESFTLETLEDEIKDELFSGQLPQSLWKLLFTAALFGSEGRLLENLDPDKPLHLLHTPYFGMIPHTADHINTAEFLVNNYKNLEAINQETNIDVETIIDFCNACDAIQLLRNEENNKEEQVELSTDTDELNTIENDTTIESEMIRETPVPKKSGLINSLWSNLTKTS